MSVTSDVAAVEFRASEIAGPSERRAAEPGRSFAKAVAGNVEELVRRAAYAEHLDPALLRAVARTESDMDPAARSRAGAEGVMQLMPATAQALGVENPYDPSQNVRGGALYLRELLDRFGGNVRLAVAAYNAGPGAVERSGGVPPYPETRRYVERVLDAYRESRR